MPDASDPQTCRRCRLAEGRSRVVLPDGARGGVMAVGEAPGAEEDQHGVGFFGLAGRNLDAAFAEAGVARTGYARANVVRCRPPENRSPRADEVAACSEWLLEAIEAFEPRVLLAVGRTAADHLLGIGRGKYLWAVEDSVSRVEREIMGEGVGEVDLHGPTGLPVVMMPHTSPLAWNRAYADRQGRCPRIRSLGERAVRAAVELAHECRGYERREVEND
ncbi:uracil-DNA glycosylase, family 4 [Thiohalospira halophila DSM 15071]|uniref:Uracil-DNA glycosylase, family 4 n=1 Tax=Thiohalospira halophila DSM 15071 TaxID=1123397 RepID=A0A1I1NAY1_9GAMM|nr:uracil-DNA glycosylase [Thiohalospira halophila]SFC90890.1 uracil-DNA glycosylase, family 4 [Thiohalospira halophila DSM 15071]